jgi:uroporphyrinogen-III synthase
VSSSNPLFLWVTRSAPLNMLTAKHLRAAGHNPMAIPVLETRPLPHRLNAFGASALVFTSPNGVRHHLFSSALRTVPVFAVGDRTASLAREAGYRSVRSAQGNVSDLLRLIRATLQPPGRIIHLCAVAPAGDLTGELNNAGFRAERLHVYETVPRGAEHLRPALASLPWSDGVIIHSPRAAEQVASFLADLGAGWSGTAYCISDAAAAPLRRLGVDTQVAPEPSDESLRSIIGTSAGVPTERFFHPFGPTSGSRATEDLHAANEGMLPSGTILPFRRRPTSWAVDPDDPLPPSAA